MKKTRCSGVLAPVVASVLASGVSTTATADFYDAVVHQYWIQTLDFGGTNISVYVQDVYLLSDDAWEGQSGSGDTLLNVYNWNTVSGAPVGFFQSFTNTGWLAKNYGYPFDTEALQVADSFVTIGGFGPDVRQTTGAGAGSGLDPGFGGNSVSAPQPGGGWFNGSPPSHNGAAMVYDNGTLGTLIGRFASTTPSGSLVGTTFGATWNQGLGTGGQTASFTITDAIGSFDCNQNGVPDDIDLENGVLADCDGNGTADECEIPIPLYESPTLACPLAGETIVVQIENAPAYGVVDQTLFLDITADLDGPDRYLDIVVGNEDQVTARIEDDGDCLGGIASIPLPGFVDDWGDGLGVPLTITASPALAAACADTIRVRVHGIDAARDCDGDGLLDSCEIADGSETDCDGDGRIDRCFTPVGERGDDCDSDGIPDECQDQPDCDGDGIIDACEIADGTSTDYDADGLPDDCEGGVVGTDYATIAEGLLAAPDGGVIVVPSGTWTEPFAFDRAVTIIAPDGPETTTLSNGGAPQTIVTAHGAPSGAALVGFTITNGVGIAGQAGGGIDGIDSFLRVEDCILRGNFGVDGGGVRFQGGAPTIRGCTFRDNTSQGAGGGLRLVASDATVESCLFEMNQAATDTLGWALAVTDGLTQLRDLEATAHQGQAVHFDATAGYPATTASIERVFIHDNDLGPGVALDGDDPQLWTLVDSRICGNGPASEMDRAIIGAYSDLGANILFVDGCPDLVVPDDADTIQLAIDTALDGERIAVRPGTYDEGGLDLTGRDLELVGIEDLFEGKPSVTGPIDGSGMPLGSLIRYLAITDGTGAVDLPGYSGLAVGGGLVLDDSAVVVEDCDIFQNAADLGGGAFVRDGSVVLRDIFLTQNTATLAGGGIHAEGDVDTTLLLDTTLVVANSVPIDASTRGGGVDARGLADPASLVLGDTTISANARENLAQNPDGGSYTDLGANSVTLAVDCDGNGIEDAADIGDFGRPDCNGNLVPDDCDLASGTSRDCDANGNPDECDLGYESEPRFENHDGSGEDAVGVNEAGQMTWLEHFEVRPEFDRIRSVGIDFGDPTDPNQDFDGQLATVAIWSDPDDDGSPADASLLATTTLVVAESRTRGLQYAEFASAVDLSSATGFFVGVRIDLEPSDRLFPATRDMSADSDASWIVFDPGGVDLAVLSDASLLAPLNDFLPGRWMISAVPDLAAGPLDCNANGLIDVCEIAEDASLDCDGSGTIDSCDLANGAPDLDQDGVLDACQDQLVFLVPDRFGSIGSAIAAATDGSRIQLSAAGSPYVERVDFGTLNLELIGDPADPASVVVEAFGLDSTVITIAGDQDSSTRIAGILVKQGIADTPEPGSSTNLVGGGFYIDGADPVIEDCIIADNRAARGGGAYLRFSEAVFRRTTIQANAATGDGAGLWWSEGTVRLEDCDVLDNFAEGNGGGLRATAEDGIITGGSIANNIATNDGAGLWWQGSMQALAIDGVVITGNIAGEVGGGIKTRYGYPGVTLANSTLCDNAPDELDGVYTDLGGNDLCLCPADLNGDGEVGGEDLGLFLAYSGGECEPFTPCPGDINNDGELSGADIGKILSDWGLCP